MISLATAAMTADAAPRLRFVEVWKQSDDGLTNRLTDAVTSAVKQRPYLIPSAGGKPNTLFVVIAPVRWQDIKGRLRVNYSVDFNSPTNDHRGWQETARGFCWEADLRNCAEKIAEEAARTAKNSN